MYSTSLPASTSMNGMGGDMMDPSGTINPAALNTPVSVLPAPASGSVSNSSPRGIKRSRSPDVYGELPLGGRGDEDEQKPRKRGQLSHPSASEQQTPQLQTQGLPARSNAAAPQASPPKPTPAKTVVKALPTVRDHTTDQLSSEGDEYVPREYDDAGEKKVTPTGQPRDGREYKCRTFLVPNRGDKLFMLATECARVLGYRDSYLLFNKNRSLYKIIATQSEKDDLIHQEILPYSYRSRQIAIVTAKSMFRQFGSRVILYGRRVRDDYWEAKARKQGFTEEDLAGEKRPGGAKAAREAQAADQAAAALGQQHHDIVYSNGPGMVPIDALGHPQLLQPGVGGQIGATLAPLPMIHSAGQEEIRLRDYGNIQRPRQEVAGPPYQDRLQPSPATEIQNQAIQTAEYSKSLNQQRSYRGKLMEDYWKQPRDVPASSPLHQGTESSPPISQPPQSPLLPSGGSVLNASHQPGLQHQSSHITSPQTYSQQPHQQTAFAQSPIRPGPQQIRSDQVQRRPSSLSYSSSTLAQGSPYTYQQPSQVWGQPPPQPQQSPLTAQHTSMSQYSQQHQQQPPQHAHPAQSPHPSHSPHQHTPQPQLQHPPSGGSMHGAALGGFQGGVPSMAQAGYAGMGMGGRTLYQQQPAGHHGYLQGQTTAGGAATLQGWAPPGHQPPPQQGQGGPQSWQGY